jgi:hypothetical protein
VVELPRLPTDLIARLRADPAHAPETLALAAEERHAPGAARWAAEMREAYGLEGRELAERAVRKHGQLARVSGAAGGVGGALTMLPDLVALLWIQSRMVLHVAAACGFDPHDRMRPAELLVILGLYATPAQARTALDGAGRSVALAYVDRGLRPAGEDEQLARRLLSIATRHAGRSLAGRAIPGLAIVVGAAGNERATKALGADAVAFYARP